MAGELQYLCRLYIVSVLIVASMVRVDAFYERGSEVISLRSSKDVDAIAKSKFLWIVGQSCYSRHTHALFLFFFSSSLSLSLSLSLLSTSFFPYSSFHFSVSLLSLPLPHLSNTYTHLQAFSSSFASLFWVVLSFPIHLTFYQNCTERVADTVSNWLLSMKERLRNLARWLLVFMLLLSLLLLLLLLLLLFSFTLQTRSLGHKQKITQTYIYNQLVRVAAVDVEKNADIASSLQRIYNFQVILILYLSIPLCSFETLFNLYTYLYTYTCTHAYQDCTRMCIYSFFCQASLNAF